MKCIYELEVRAKCPANPETIDTYQFTITTGKMVAVEEIIAFFAHNGRDPVYQESLTQQCATKFDAMVTSVGEHSGVKTTCCEAP